MSAETKVLSNQMLLSMILDKLTSQQLLDPRVVCKLWRDEANRLIRLRQQKFFYSPTTKTCSPESYNDLKWKHSWDNVIQISFIYSPKLNTFIRASRRLIETPHNSVQFKASALNPQERLIESSYNEEIDLFCGPRMPTVSSNFHCKMAGHTLDAFTDFLESMPGEFHDNIENSILPQLSFRFECGQLLDRFEVSWFLGLMGPHIRYLTVGANHLCDKDHKWDQSYQVFKQVPNIQVLTVIMSSRWLQKENPGGYLIDLVESVDDRLQVDAGETVPFSKLQCLRIPGLGDLVNGQIAYQILCKAPKVQRVVFEKGLSFGTMSLLRKFGRLEDEPKKREGLQKLLPNLLRLITPISMLSVRIFEESPSFLGCIANMIQKLPGCQRIKTLNLFLTSPPDFRNGTPYRSSIVPLLLQVLKLLARSLETLSLIGGAGVFLEGLIQTNKYYDREKPYLQGFPRVRKLLVCPGQVNSLDRRDFDLSDGVSFDPTLTTLSKVFPRVEELDLDDHFCFHRNGRDNSWIAFLPRRRDESQARLQRQVDEVKFVKKVHFGRMFSVRAFQAWRFSSLETLCLDYVPFSVVAPRIWSLTTLQTLMIRIDRIPSDVDHGQGLPMLEAILTGVSNEVIVETDEVIRSSLPHVPPGEAYKEFLMMQHTVFRSRMRSPSILNLKQLRHFKLFYTLSHTNGKIQMSRPMFSPLFGMFILEKLLPPSCHTTIWAKVDAKVIFPLEVLEKIVGSWVRIHPRLTLRTIRHDALGPEQPF